MMINDKQEGRDVRFLLLIFVFCYFPKLFCKDSVRPNLKNPLFKKYMKMPVAIHLVEMLAVLTVLGFVTVSAIALFTIEKMLVAFVVIVKVCISIQIKIAMTSDCMRGLK